MNSTKIHNKIDNKINNYCDSIDIYKTNLKKQPQLLNQIVDDFFNNIQTCTKLDLFFKDKYLNTLKTKERRYTNS